jgi:hypothetical protein
MTVRCRICGTPVGADGARVPGTAAVLCGKHAAIARAMVQGGASRGTRAMIARFPAVGRALQVAQGVQRMLAPPEPEPAPPADEGPTVIEVEAREVSR